MNLTHKALLLLGLALTAAALLGQVPQPGTQTATPKREARLEQRAGNQQKRIQQGTASGQLTGKEAAALERREAKIDKDIAKAEADGRVTQKEAQRIHAEQNKASKKIHHQKHDTQTTAPVRR